MTSSPAARPPLGARLLDYARLMRLDKPVGIWLLLWPTWWGLWLGAHGRPSWHVLAVFTLGTVLTRSAGCVINDYFDRDIDPHVARTGTRPIASGRVRPGEALRLALALALIAWGLVATLDVVTASLAVPAALTAGAYPLAKRWLVVPQAHLGIAFSWGIPMAFTATRLEHVAPPASLAAYGAQLAGAIDGRAVGLLVAANLCWVIAYDTLYAMVDRDDDVRLGVKSSAIFFGRADLLACTALTGVSLALMAWVGGLEKLRFPPFREGVYAGGWALAALNAWWMLRRARTRARGDCFAAFKGFHWYGLALWAGLAGAYALG